MLPEFVNIRRRYCRTGWAKKLSSKLHRRSDRAVRRQAL